MGRTERQRRERDGGVKGKWRGQNQASRPEEGGYLVPCQLEIRENTEQRGSQVDKSEFGRSLCYCLGAGLAGFGKRTPKQRTEPCSLSFLGGPLFCARTHQKQGQATSRREGRAGGGLAPHSHADKRQVTLAPVETGSSAAVAPGKGAGSPQLW